MNATRALAVGATLGEGPVWVARDAALWFVDIKGRRIHRFDPATRAHRTWLAPGELGWVLPADNGGFLAGLRQGVAQFDPSSDRFTIIAEPEADQPGNRLNDATVDLEGRVWFGSMDNGEQASTGRVYVFEAGRVRDSGLSPVCITNGPAISADASTLFHTDTLGRTIYAVPLHDDGTLGIPRVFATVDPADGWPDGCTADAEGGLWTGLWGGWRARRYTPDGMVDREVRFPVANVTKVAFGGPDLRTGYATTARKDLDAIALAAQPQAGDLFEFDPGVAGLPGGIARTTDKNKGRD